MFNNFSKNNKRPLLYTSFEISVWYSEGKAVLYLGSTDYDETVCFHKDYFDFEDTNGNLPENFFDDITENIKNVFRQPLPVACQYVKEDLSKELAGLYANRDKAHNLIWNTKMFSVKESDYYNYRELFPSDWEDCFEYKEYFFVLLKDRGLKMKDADGNIMDCNDGYIQISAMSIIDARTFYEEWLCRNLNWRYEQAWFLGPEKMDCDKIISAITKKKRERYPEHVKAIEECHRQYGLFSEKKCYQRVEIDKEWKI